MCRPPAGSALDAQVSHWVDIARARWLFRIVLDHWRVFSLCACLAVALSYAWLCFLYVSGEALVKLGIVLLAGIPLIVGCWMAGMHRLIPVVGEVLPDPPGGGVIQVEAVVLILVGVTFSGVACSMRWAINRAVDCLEMSFICVCQTRTILHPLAIVLLYCCATFTTCSGIVIWKAHHRDQSILTSPAHVTCLYLLVFTLAWISQAVFTYSEYALDFVTATWCFKGGLASGGARLTNRDIVGAYTTAIRYHWGTCVFGALVISVVRPLDLTVGVLVRCCAMPTNPFSCVVGLCCGQFLQGWQHHIAAQGKEAFLEVAMSGSPFCEAARSSQLILEMQDGVTKVLGGATKIIQFCCIAFNSGAGALCAAAVFGLAHPDAEHSEFWEVVVVAAVVSAVATLPFVLLFDTVADAILYCIAIQEQRECSEKEASAERYALAEALPCVPCVLRNPLFRRACALGA